MTLPIGVDASTKEVLALPNGADHASTKEVLDAQSHIWNLMLNYVSSMSLKCAIQLGIPDAIHKHGKPMSLSQLADALAINKAKSPSLYRIMRILVHSKIFESVKDEHEEEETYSLTLASHLLLGDVKHLSVAPLVLTMVDSVITEPLHHMSKWFRNDHPSTFFTKHGKTSWEYAGSDPEWNQLYNVGMASDARFVASILVRECRHVFEGLRTMVDVGGGTGVVAKAVADAIPGMKAIVLELPQVIAGLEGSENLSYVCGDMMKFIPPADAVFLKWNLHMWNHEDGVKLLRKCKESINPSKGKGGKVIILEIVAGDQKEDHEAIETQLFFDIVLMSRIAGGERTEKEWAKLFSDAGFTSYKISPVLGLRSLIEVFP